MPPESDGLTVADLTGNGKLDLLVGDAYGDVLVLLGNGDGTFQPYHEANQSIELAVADLTGNGSKDIIYADQGLDRVVVDYGAGNSSVLANQSTGLLEPGAVALADLNGDGIPDLIVANSGSNNVLIYPGLGNGQFGPAINGGNGYFVGTNPVGITVANLTGDLARPGGRRRGLEPGVDPAQPVAAGRRDLVRGGPAAEFRRLGAGLHGGGELHRRSLSRPPGHQQPVERRHAAAGSRPGLLQRPEPADLLRRQPIPAPSFVGNFNGQTDLVTVNAGSNDLTLISGFDGRRSGDQHDLFRRRRPDDGLRVRARATASRTWSSATPATACWRCSRAARRA